MLFSKIENLISRGSFKAKINVLKRPCYSKFNLVRIAHNERAPPQDAVTDSRLTVLAEQESMAPLAAVTSPPLASLIGYSSHVSSVAKRALSGEK